MPHITQHTTKVLTGFTRSVNPYARESPRKRQQQDRQTLTHTQTLTHRRIVQNHFSQRFEHALYAYVPYIPNPVTSQTRFFAPFQHFHGILDNTFFRILRLTHTTKLFDYRYVQVHHSATQGRWAGALSRLVTFVELTKIKTKKLYLWRSLSLCCSQKRTMFILRGFLVLKVITRGIASIALGFRRITVGVTSMTSITTTTLGITCYKYFKHYTQYYKY